MSTSLLTESFLRRACDPLIWLKRFRERNGRVACAAAPLYTYKCSDAEYIELREMLSSSDLLGHAALQCFCLFASEWFRREFAGGSWSWDGPLEAIGLTEGERPPYDAMERALVSGWELDVIRAGGHREFLATLLVQGGLPLRTLEQESGTLRKIFQLLIAEAAQTSHTPASLERIAEASKGLLPGLLQVRIAFELLAAIALAAVELSARVPEGSDSVEYLEREVPGWEELIPFSPTDEITRILVRALVKDAHSATVQGLSPLRVVTKLVQLDDGLELTRELRLPDRLNAAELRALFGCDDSITLPDELRLDLQLLDRDESQFIAHAVRWERDWESDAPGEELFHLECVWHTVKLKSLASCELSATGLLPAGASVSLGPVSLDGGEDLEESVPLVFRPVVRQRAATSTTEWILAAQGAASLRSRSLRVVVPEGATLEQAARDGLEQLGSLRADGREVFELRGVGAVLHESDRYVLRTAVSREAGGSYHLRGTSFDLALGKRATYRGLPQVQISGVAGRFKTVPVEQLQWRPRGIRAQWRDDWQAAAGEIELRHVSEGQTLHRRRLRLVPARAEFSLHPDSGPSTGRILLNHLGAGCELNVSERGVHSGEVGRLPSGAMMVSVRAQGQAGAPLELQLRWPSGATMGLQVPLPVIAVHFVHAGGAKLPDGARICFERLHEYRAEIIGAGSTSDRARLELCLYEPRDIGASTRTRQIAVVPSSGDARAQLSLIELRANIRRLFTSSKRPESRVILKLNAGGVRRFLKVYRAQAGLRIDHETSTVSLVGWAAREFADDVEIEAIALRDPRPEQRVELPRVEPPPRPSPEPEEAAPKEATAQQEPGQASPELGAAPEAAEIDSEPGFVSPYWGFDDHLRAMGSHWLVGRRRGDGRVVTAGVLLRPLRDDADENSPPATFDGDSQGCEQTGAESIPGSDPCAQSGSYARRGQRFPQVDISTLQSLVEAIELPVLKFRRQAFARFMREMEDDLDHPDWVTLERFLATVGDIDVTSFDLIEVLIHNPTAAIAAILRQPVSRVPVLWRAFEELPFQWHLVPFNSWIKALEAWKRYMAVAPSGAELARRQFEIVAQIALREHPALEFVFHAARLRMFGSEAQLGRELGCMGNPQISKSRLQQLDESKLALFRHAAALDEARPGTLTWPRTPLFDRVLQTAIPQLVPRELGQLFINPEGVIPRLAVLNAPVVAALAVLRSEIVDASRWLPYLDVDIRWNQVLFELMELRSFSPEWYEKCFRITLERLATIHPSTLLGTEE